MYKFKWEVFGVEDFVTVLANTIEEAREKLQTIFPSHDLRHSFLHSVTEIEKESSCADKDKGNSDAK